MKKRFGVHGTRKIFKWHVKDTLIEYKTNEVGARDDPFIKLDEENNIILLGDSFAEGYGIEKENMFEAKIEKLTDKTVLNFSSSKDFGSIYFNLRKSCKKKTITIQLLFRSFLIMISRIILFLFKENKLDF